MSKKGASAKGKDISRDPYTSSGNSDYRSLGSDWASSEDDWYQPQSSERAGYPVTSLPTFPSPNVTLSRGPKSSRIRSAPVASDSDTPSGLALEADTFTPTPSLSTVKKRTQNLGSPMKPAYPRTPSASARYLDDIVGQPSASTSSGALPSPVKISSNFLQTLTPKWENVQSQSPSQKLRSIPRSPPVKPQRTIVIPDSDSDLEATDTESDSSQLSPLASRNIFSSQSTIPSNATSMTSLGSQSSLNLGRSSSNVSNPAESHYNAITTPVRHRAQKKRDSPLPIRGAQLPNSPTSSRPKYNTPSSRPDVFSQPIPDTYIPPVAGPSTPKRSATVPGPPGPSGSKAPAPSAPIRSTSTPGASTAPKLRAPPPPTPAPLTYSPSPSAAPRSVPNQPEAAYPAAVDAFVQRDRCGDLQCHIIAHDEQAQAQFDAKRIEWGVQFQLARGQSIGLWTWEQVIQSVEKLTGTNEEVGPKVLSVMLPEKATNATDHKVWAEFDREQAAILENKGRGLGLMGDWMGVADWYGGRIQQLALLTKKDDGKLTLTLEPLEKRRSHRVARFLGSRRVLQIRVPEKLTLELGDEVRKFFARRFILLGRTFVPFHVKDGSVYMLEIRLDYGRLPQDWCGDQFRLSFMEFMEWHNPMSLNYKQAISKFVTRFAIPLSNTIPIIEFAAHNMFFIEDINSSDSRVDNPKADTEKIMTDGCGFINLAALAIITRKIGYESAPTAVQGRIDGSKGLWVRHPTDEYEEPRIWIRDSQNKIKNPRLDRAHRIFDLLGPAKAWTCVSLSTQSILNLHHNDVPSGTIVGLFRQGLKDEVTPLLQWESMPLLYNAVNKAGGVAGARLARISDGNGRALGVQRAQWRPDEVEETANDDEKELDTATYTGRNPYSGAPHSIHEYVLELIQAGFTPQTCFMVQSKLKQVIKNVVDSAVEKYRIPMDGSIAAWLIPDPLARNPTAGDWNQATSRRDDLGLLKEGQIYFRSSQPLKDENELAYHVITGEVVIGRYPMRLASDLQKVTAVDIPEYALYTDVVIVSVNGNTSLPSLLSGGDMDGDIVNIFRHPELVRHFQSKPLTPRPAGLMEENFEKDIVSVQAFCSRAMEMSSAKAQEWYLEFILKDVLTPQKGLYSGFHDASVARFGYDHPHTIRLAYIFNDLLDASKTGLRLKAGIFEKDQKAAGSKPAPYGILASLHAEGKRILDEFMRTFDETATATSPDGRDVSAFKDRDLLKPYDEAIVLALSLQDVHLRPGEDVKERDQRVLVGRYMHDELRAIRRHVDAAKDEFMARFGRKMQQESQLGSQSSPSKTRASKSSYGKTKSDQADEMYKAAKMFGEPVDGVRIYLANLEEMKASCAVYCESAKAHFPFTVAFKGLCTIKAKARGIAPAIREIDECKGMSSSVAKVLAKTSGAVVF